MRPRHINVHGVAVCGRASMGQGWLSIGKRISMQVNRQDLVCTVYMMWAECSVFEEVASNEQ